MSERPRAGRRVALPLDGQETEPAESTDMLVPGPQRAGPERPGAVRRERGS
jgi:hypothetical protein